MADTSAHLAIAGQLDRIANALEAAEARRVAADARRAAILNYWEPPAQSRPQPDPTAKPKYKLQTWDGDMTTAKEVPLTAT